MEFTSYSPYFSTLCHWAWRVCDKKSVYFLSIQLCQRYLSLKKIEIGDIQKILCACIVISKHVKDQLEIENDLEDLSFVTSNTHSPDQIEESVEDVLLLIGGEVLEPTFYDLLEEKDFESLEDMMYLLSAHIVWYLPREEVISFLHEDVKTNKSLEEILSVERINYERFWGNKLEELPKIIHRQKKVIKEDVPARGGLSLPPEYIEMCVVDSREKIHLCNTVEDCTILRKTEKDRKSLIAEYVALLHLKHENIIELKYFDYKKSSIYMDCGDSPFDVEWTVDMLRDLSLGLQYIHSMGIVHRDIKITNVVVIDNIPKFIDFGCAAMMIDEPILAFTTYFLVPPENAKEDHDMELYTYAADIWALGITIASIRKEFCNCQLNKDPKDLDFDIIIGCSKYYPVTRMLCYKPEDRVLSKDLHTLF